MLYHIGLDSEKTENAKYAIITGDPLRVGKLASFLDNPRQIGQNREYTSYIGYIEGVPVVVMSHGIGGPSTAIAVEELSQLGIETIIRVGTSGGMQEKVMAGDVVVVNAAIRQEGTSKEYLPVEFPAVADFEVTSALKEAAEKLNQAYHIGIVHCKDSFYGQHSPERMPVSNELLAKWDAWIRGGALVSEMETAALYTVSSTLNIRAGGVMLCIWNQERDRAGYEHEECHETERAIKVAVEAVSILIRKDRE